LRYLFDDYTFDTERRELHRGTDVVSITPQVFDLLDYLIRNRERVVSKDDLISVVWNGRIVTEAALTTRLNAARSAVGDSGHEQRLIKTLPRKGFRFVATVREAQGPTGAEVADSPVEPVKPAPTLPNKPSIAVLPFANLSSDPEQEYFADGVVEDITMALSRFLAGWPEPAQKALARALECNPDLRASNLEDLAPFRRAEDLATFAKGLREAGLPE
jgi:DNA-binding winged helix-turn-helix (wHTH) protein